MKHLIHDNLQDKAAPEWWEYLQEQFINPLETDGAIFLGYGHLASDESCGGIHILQFDNLGDDFDLNTIMDQDDNQPPTSFQRYFNACWIFIPYFA